jgi:hypothetical protein
MEPGTDFTQSLSGMILESLPYSVVASIEVRDAWRRQAASAAEGLEFIVSDLVRWRPGSTVRVAFLDGESALHANVAEATRQITSACNLHLDFGWDEAAGEYRRWRETDTAYAAEIRISFDREGYWSLVGTDSTDRTVGAAGDPAGGRPGQRSLNLGGFTRRLPAGWQGTVRHEFLHALAFRHAHQNLRGPCEQEFRWEDDPGYEPAQDSRGVFVADRSGRRPGIYTYLAGAPNHWPRWMVDHNLRKDESADVIAGPFDPASIMLYAFDSFFYKTTPSECAPTGNGIDLSDGDRRGLRLLYPHTAAEVTEVTERAVRVLDQIGAGAEAGFETAAGPGSPYRARVIDLLTAFAGA